MFEKVKNYMAAEEKPEAKVSLDEPASCLPRDEVLALRESGIRSGFEMSIWNTGPGLLGFGRVKGTLSSRSVMVPGSETPHLATLSFAAMRTDRTDPFPMLVALQSANCMVRRERASKEGLRTNRDMVGKKMWEVSNRRFEIRGAKDLSEIAYTGTNKIGIKELAANIATPFANPLLWHSGEN